MDNVLMEVDKIIAALQKGKWSDHNPSKLSAAQGKLASYISNVISMANDAQYKAELLELNAKQAEAERFMHYRKAGSTIDESKLSARLDVHAKMVDVLEAQHDYQNLKGIVDAMKNLCVACSTTIKFYEQERYQSSKV